jgi:hypothetical protein
MSNRFLPRRSRHASVREHFQFVVLGLGTIYEGLVMVLSLGFLNVETRSWMLFNLFEED